LIFWLFFDEVCEGFFDEGNFSSTADFNIHYAQVKGTSSRYNKTERNRRVAPSLYVSELLSLSSSLRAYMSAIESGVPDFDTDFTSHSPQKTRKPCFFVQYVFNVTKSIRNCRLVSPLFTGDKNAELRVFSLWQWEAPYCTVRDWGLGTGEEGYRIKGFRNSELARLLGDCCIFHASSSPDKNAELRVFSIWQWEVPCRIFQVSNPGDNPRR
jgi:hypothetical protein